MKKIGLIIVSVILLCFVGCGNKEQDLQHPKKYVGIYDGEDKSFLDLKSDGSGIFRYYTYDKGTQNGNLTWYVDNSTIYITTSKYELHADLHNFNDSLLISGNNRWTTEMFKKRK